MSADRGSKPDRISDGCVVTMKSGERVKLPYSAGRIKKMRKAKKVLDAAEKGEKYKIHCKYIVNISPQYK